MVCLLARYFFAYLPRHLLRCVVRATSVMVYCNLFHNELQSETTLRNVLDAKSAKEVIEGSNV